MANSANSRTARAVHPLTGSTPPGADTYGKLRATRGPKAKVHTKRVCTSPDTITARLVPLIKREHDVQRRLQMLEQHSLLPELRSRLDRIAVRMLNRIQRWTRRLMAHQPADARIAAVKADAYVALAAAGWTGTGYDLGEELALSVAQDAARLGIDAETKERLFENQAQDGETFSLIARHAAALAEWEAADDASDAPRAAYLSVVPTRPRQLFWSANDPAKPDATVPVPGARGSWHYVYDEADVDRLRQKPATRIVEHHSPADWNPDDTVVRREIVPDAVGETRRLQIIAVYDGWEDEKAALRDSTGLTAANDLVEAAAEVLFGLEDAILRSTPNTLSGLQAKARWIARRPKPANLGIHLLRDLCSMPTVPVASPAQVEPSRDVIETYRTFLDMEFRFLNWETHGTAGASGGIWLDNPAGRLHGGDGPQPSSRAITVLTALGLMPNTPAKDKHEAATEAA